jgi:uncharacterized protein
MILKLILLAVIGIMIYKFFGGRLPAMPKPKKSAPRKEATKEETKKLEENTLVECVRCGTYVTIKESIIVHGKYYCDECA